MRMLSFFLLALCLTAHASGVAQKITLSGRNLDLKDVFTAIEKQTGYVLFAKKDLLLNTKPVTIAAHDMPLTEFLQSILKNQSLDYVIQGKTVILSRKKNTAPVTAPVVAAQADDTPPVTLRIIDSAGRPLAGASVSIKKSRIVAVSDAQGHISLNVQEGDELVISFIGYEDRSLLITQAILQKPAFTLALKAAVSSLDELTVSINTGYQRIKKDQLTGAATTINEEQYQQRVAVTGNFLESLEGKVPGLVYNSQSGELTIRGVSTFDAVKQPLIVLDGFPTEIDLRTINPNDIVSVSVLRDAAAASIYGVRASNGVIVVETRRGRAGNPVFTLKSTYAVQNKPDLSYLKYAPASEFVQLQKDYFNTAQTSYLLYQLGYYKMNPVEEILFGKTQLTVSNPLLTDEQANQKIAALGSYDNLHEYEKLFYQNKQATNINLDVSGGNNKSTYMLGVNYVAETPVTRRSDNKQLILNLANTFTFTERLKFDFRGNYINSAAQSGNIPAYSDFYPYEHLTDANGKATAVALDPGRDYISRAMTKDKNNALMAVGLYDQFYYPYRELTSNTNTTKGSSVRFQGRLTAKVSNWLSMDLGGNYEYQNNQLDKLQLEDAYAVRVLVSGMAQKDAATGKALFTNMPPGNILTRTNQKISNYTLRAQLNFAHKFDKGVHDLSGILGVEQKKTLLQGYMTSYFGYDGQTLISKPINMSALNATTTSPFSAQGMSVTNRFVSTNYFNQTETDRRFMSFYAQGTYIFNRKYVATGSARIDQSNLFGADPAYKYKPLWSAGLNWRMHEEAFLQSVNWLENLQLRAATGFNGNVPSSNNGKFLILSTGLNTVLNTPLAYNDVLTPENQSLRWETTQNYNIGADYSLFENRVSGSIDWYLKKTKDVFGQFDADPTSGFNQYYANTASIQNRGVEVMVNTVNVKHKNFRWNTQVTASFNQSKVLAVKATEYANSQLITNGTNNIKGLPLGALFSYNYGGLNAMGQPFVYDRAGKQRVLAFYGTSQVDVTQNDLIYNGTTTPKYVLGLNNQFSVGAFDISVLFMYYGGHVMRVEQPNPNNIGFYANNPLQGASGFWRKAGDEKTTRIPGYVRASSLAPGYYQSYALYGYQYASEFVRKADYIRLRDVVVTYHARAKFFQQIGLRNAELRLQAQNPFRYTFSGNDIDPEAIDRITGIRRLETQPFYSFTLFTNF